MSRRKEKLEASLEGLFSSTKRGTPAKQPDLPDEKPVAAVPVPAEGEGSVQKLPEKALEKPVTVSSPPSKPIIPSTPQRIETEPKKATPPIVTSKTGMISEPEAIMINAAGEAIVKQATPTAIKTMVSQPEERVISSANLLQSDGIQVVVFMLQGDYYGIDISDVQTIIKPQTACPVPHTADYLVGLINLRGQVVPVIDLRKRLNFPALEAAGESRIIIVNIRDEWAGLLVDEVTGVQILPSGSIEPPSLVLVSADVGLLSGIAKSEEKLILILDIAKVFSHAVIG